MLIQSIVPLAYWGDFVISGLKRAFLNVAPIIKLN